MKKLGLLVMPLMAISLLVSCGGSKPQVVEHFVSFDSKGGDYVKTQRVKDGDTATKPDPEPTRDNDEFKGWFTDDGTFQNPYMFTESVTDDVTLYAKWHEVAGTTFTVTFMNGDSEYAKIDGIEPKQHISSPGSPEKPHYNFIGWCTDIEGKNKFDFAEIEINQNYTLYAGYEKNCTIIFKNNGEDYASAEAIKGTAIPMEQLPINPTIPPAPGQTFIGWGYDTTGQYMINDLATAKFYEETTTLHANWTSTPISTTYTISFSCTNCKVFDETGQTEIVNSIDIPVVGSYITYCKFMIKGKDDYKAPFSKSSITVKKTGGQDVEFYYDGKTCEITVPIHDDLTITSNGVNKTLEDFTWAEISEISTLGRADEFFDVYDPNQPELNCKKVQLKHQDSKGDGADTISEGELYQTVRIIDFNQDVDRNGNNIGITFEFADLISDENGYSLASLWQDTSSSTDANFDYLNSTIRKNLTGYGNGDTMWYEKDSAIRSSRSQSVLDMLPNDLRSVLKIAKKKVNLKTTGSWVETDLTDELFLLSANEMNEQKTDAEEGEAYQYYKNAIPGEANSIRIKQQIKGADGARTDKKDITDNTYGSGTSYAGYNSSDGARLWLRSPNTSVTTYSWYVNESGSVVGSIVYYVAYGVAPAFCI